MLFWMLRLSLKSSRKHLCHIERVRALQHHEKDHKVGKEKISTFLPSAPRRGSNILEYNLCPFPHPMVERGILGVGGGRLGWELLSIYYLTTNWRVFFTYVKAEKIRAAWNSTSFQISFFLLAITLAQTKWSTKYVSHTPSFCSLALRQTWPTHYARNSGRRGGGLAKSCYTCSVLAGESSDYQNTLWG